MDSCQNVALHKGQCDENKNEYYPVEIFGGLFVHL